MSEDWEKVKLLLISIFPADSWWYVMRALKKITFKMAPTDRAEKRLRMRETLAPNSLVRVGFLFDLFCPFDVLFVWFVPRNGP